MFDWLKRLKTWLRPRRCLSGLPDCGDLPAVTRLPVYEQGPFIPPFINPVLKCTGIIWCWDHARPLGWREYKYWETRILPRGWGIIEPPDEGAMVPGERWRDDAAAT